MYRTYRAIEKLVEPPEEMTDSVGTVANVLGEMKERCEEFRLRRDGEAAFGEAKAEEVRKLWEEVGDACKKWLYMFNEQQISPITCSVV